MFVTNVNPLPVLSDDTERIIMRLRRTEARRRRRYLRRIRKDNWRIRCEMEEWEHKMLGLS